MSTIVAMGGVLSRVRQDRAALIAGTLTYIVISAFALGIVPPGSSATINPAVKGQHLVWCCGKVSNVNESWRIFAPPSEGGNITSQARYLASDKKDVGVVLDDFSQQGQLIQSEMISAIPSRFGANVCPVISGEGLLTGSGSDWPYTRCAVLVVEPMAGAGPGRDLDLFFSAPMQVKSALVNATTVSNWKSIIGSIVSAEGEGKSLFLLVYVRPYSGWTMPIPMNYVTAVKEYAAEHGLGLITWGGS